ncbi:MAG: glycosyltransferase family 9 protein [Bacteriovoracia bacterium]
MKILINRTDAIGDTVLTLPMAQLIKEKYPEAEIYFLVSAVSQDIFINHPDVKQCFVFPKKKNKIQQLYFLLKLFRKEKFDVYFHVGGVHLPSMVAFLTGVKIRAGLLCKPSSFIWLNKGMRQYRSMVEMHEVEYNLNLLQTLDINYNFKMRDRISPGIVMTVQEKNESFKNFNDSLSESQKRMERELIFIHPGMTGHTLNWPCKNYGRYILKMEEKYPGRFLFVLSHTPADKRFIIPVERIIKKKNPNLWDEGVYLFNGAARGLRDYMGTLSHAKLFLGPSTGTTHLANALGVKVIGLYSPIKVQSVHRWAPFLRGEDKLRLIVPEVVCGEKFSCALEKCPYYECMSKIEVEWVIRESDQLLK